MSEHGFYHPDVGYWQTIDDVPDEILHTYPEGTIEVDLKPGTDYELVGLKWVPVPVTHPIELGELTARQLRLGLLDIGIKPTDVAAAIDQLPSPEKELAQIEWEYANTFQREHPLIAVLANHFGLSKEAVDAAWRTSMAI